jgi:hypothetical protein
MTLELGFLKLDYRGVNEVIGVSISVDDCCSLMLVAGVASVERDASYPFFKKASSRAVA